MGTGTKQDPIRLRSVDGGGHLPDDSWIVIARRMVEQLQRREPYDSRHPNTRELLADDPLVPAIQPDYVAINTLLFPSVNGSNGNGTARVKRNDVCVGVSLTNEQKMVLLGRNCLIEPMSKQAIAVAMKITENDVHRHLWHCDKARTQWEKDSAKPKPKPMLPPPQAEDSGFDPKLDMVMPIKVLRVLQMGFKSDADHDLGHKPRGKAMMSDYRELRRLFYGEDPKDNHIFQRVKLYLGSQVALPDKQKLVVMAMTFLSEPMSYRAIGRCLSIMPNHVRLLRRQSVQTMRGAPPAELIEANTERRARLLREIRSLPEPVCV